MKKDVFGEIFLDRSGPDPVIIRDCGNARFGARLLARRFLAKEAATLAAIDGCAGVPQLLKLESSILHRSYIEGKPIHSSAPKSVDFFNTAAKLLRHLHQRGVVHNDLAKEANVLIDSHGDPAFIDYQLSMVVPARGKLFRVLAREDLRHLLKHKRTYFPDLLTAREREILSAPSWLSRAWMATGKPVYLFVTRRLLGWADREGAADRSSTETDAGSNEHKT